MEPELKTCPHCGTKGILIMADGRCPHCKKPLLEEYKQLVDAQNDLTCTEASGSIENQSHTGKAREGTPSDKDLSFSSDDELSASEPDQQEQRGRALIVIAIVLIVGAIVGMLIGHNVIRAAARSGSYTSGGIASFYEETVRLNDLARKEGALDIVMGVVILSGLFLLIVGIVERRRSTRRAAGSH